MYQPPSWPWCHMEPTKLVRVTFFVFYTLMILVFKQALKSSLGFNGGVVPSLMVAVRRSLFFTEKSRTWKVPYVCKQNSQCCQLYVNKNCKNPIHPWYMFKMVSADKFLIFQTVILVKVGNTVSDATHKNQLLLLDDLLTLLQKEGDFERKG